MGNNNYVVESQRSVLPFVRGHHEIVYRNTWAEYTYAPEGKGKAKAMLCAVLDTRAMIRRVTAIVVMVAIYLLMGMTPVEASSGVIGGQLYATGGNVTVKILSADAGHTSNLYLFSPEPTQFIATNREVGKVVDLGSFQAGTELIFGITDQFTGDTFKIGPGSRNPDGQPHAKVEFVGPGIANVGFEDLYGGGDQDYNDNVFQFTSVESSPPGVMPPPDQFADEGADKSFSLGSFTDSGNNGPWAVDVDWGDGSTTSFTSATAGNLTEKTHTYSDNKLSESPYTVTVKVTDAAGESGSTTFNATVRNLSPTAELSNNGPVNEGSPVTISFSDQSDPSSADSTAGFHYAYACDGNLPDDVSYNDSRPDASTTCTFDDGPSTHTIAARIIDKDNGARDYSTTVTVNNVAPTANFTASTPVDEGGSINLSLTDPVDPSQADTAAGFSYAFDCGDGKGYGPPSNSNTTTCTALDNPSQTVKVRITDKDGGSTEYSADVSVNNVAPTVGEITVQPTGPISVNTTLTASASFTDPGTLDTHTATWDWGDGTTSPGTVSEANGSGSVTDSHIYTAAGVYTVTLTVTDKDGAPGTATYQYVVVYDPSAGFVTGGGWINSPEGACQLTTDCQNATGKANFGFVSKYHKGANVPDGNTQFQFKAGNLNFHSTSYQWLVIAGAKAQYKGEGTINGTGNYGFLLSAIDGSLPGGGGTDTFRIKIWDIASGNTVYDNQMGASDTSDPTTAISGGSIVIHS